MSNSASTCWQKYFLQTHETFYWFNTQTGEKSWTNPEVEDNADVTLKSSIQSEAENVNKKVRLESTSTTTSVDLNRELKYAVKVLNMDFNKSSFDNQDHSPIVRGEIENFKSEIKTLLQKLETLRSQFSSNTTYNETLDNMIAAKEILIAAMQNRITFSENWLREKENELKALTSSPIAVSSPGEFIIILFSRSDVFPHNNLKNVYSLDIYLYFIRDFY